MARKSRVQKRVLPEEPIVQWKAGVYARVSVSEVVQQINESNRRIVLCRQYAKAPELTVELLDSLIEKIVIHGDKKICIHFKYDNECYKEMYSRLI